MIRPTVKKSVSPLAPLFYKEGQTQGKGYIGLAAMIFGNWDPIGTARGALLFGITETLRLRDENAAHGLLLVVLAIALLLRGAS